MSFMSGRSGIRPRPRLVPSAAVLVGLVSLGGTLFLSLVLIPGIADILQALSQPVAFGIVLLLTTAVRVSAGVIGARRVRARYGLDQRGDAMPSALAGAAAGWLTFEVLAAAASLSTGVPLAWALIPVEGLRWLGETALGVFIVEPGLSDDADPRTRALLARSARR